MDMLVARHKKSLAYADYNIDISGVRCHCGKFYEEGWAGSERKAVGRSQGREQGGGATMSDQPTFAGLKEQLGGEGMRILVEKEDGSKEVITLVPPIEVQDAPEFKLHHFHCGDGMDYYFDAETGHYDGWGMAMCGNMEEAQENIKRIIDQPQASRRNKSETHEH